MPTPVPAPRRSQRQRSEATIEVLLRAARRLFAEQGYMDTSLDGIVSEAGVTKGALYHHFDSKQALFRAVFEREQEVLQRAGEEAFLRKRDPLDGFHAGCQAFLEASLDPAVQRITLLDAPAALGWEVMREVELETSLALMNEGLRRAVKAGRIAPRPVEPLAVMLFGALCEAAMMIARSDDQGAALRRFTRELKRLLDSL